MGESVDDPLHYDENNANQSRALLQELVTGGVRQIVFSSTAATYGEPQYTPLDEAHPQHPENPKAGASYSSTARCRLLKAPMACTLSHCAILTPPALLPNAGEDHEPESHLVPNVLFTALGRREYLSVIGDQYPTPDGTPVRDYVHVADLGRAHAKALVYCLLKR